MNTPILTAEQVDAAMLYQSAIDTAALPSILSGESCIMAADQLQYCLDGPGYDEEERKLIQAIINYYRIKA